MGRGLRFSKRTTRFASASTNTLWTASLAKQQLRRMCLPRPKVCWRVCWRATTALYLYDLGGWVHVGGEYWGLRHSTVIATIALYYAPPASTLSAMPTYLRIVALLLIVAHFILYRFYSVLSGVWANIGRQNLYDARNTRQRPRPSWNHSSCLGLHIY